MKLIVFDGLRHNGLKEAGILFAEQLQDTATEWMLKLNLSLNSFYIAFHFDDALFPVIPSSRRFLQYVSSCGMLYFPMGTCSLKSFKFKMKYQLINFQHTLTIHFMATLTGN